MQVSFFKKAVASVTAFSVVAMSMGVMAVSSIAAAPMTNVSNTMSRQQVSVNASHSIVFTVPSVLTSGNTLELTLDTLFGLGSVAVGDFSITSGGTATFTNLAWSSPTFSAEVATAGAAGETITITIANTNITNPATAGTYSFVIEHFDSGSNLLDSATVGVPVLDDDTVEVTGFIQDLITFDIDTTADTSSATGTDCDAAGGGTPCEGHSNPVAAGIFDNVGYTVSLGNLITSDYNESGDTVVHEDGNTGQINTIGFDLTANVSGGAVVTVLSSNGALVNGGDNIPSVAYNSTVDLGAGAGYGVKYRNSQTTAGAITPVAAYNGAVGVYGGVDTVGGAIFNSGSAAVENARVLFNVAGRADATDPNGTYTDTLTFVATATF